MLWHLVDIHSATGKCVGAVVVDQQFGIVAPDRLPIPIGWVAANNSPAPNLLVPLSTCHVPPSAIRSRHHWRDRAAADLAARQCGEPGRRAQVPSTLRCKRIRR